MAKLSITADEDDELVLERGAEEPSIHEYSLCLVSRFLIDRQINFLVMKHRLASLWLPGNQPRSIFVSIISSARVQRVIDGGPWTFENHLILHQQKQGEVHSTIALYHVPFWV